MSLSENDLFPGEAVLRSKGSNLLIDAYAYGLPPFLPTIASFGSKRLETTTGNHEGLGGRLYLTNYRLLFRAHDFNRVTGQKSIALHAVVALEDVSRFLARKAAIRTGDETFTFVIWGVPAFLRATREATNRRTPMDGAAFDALAAAEPAKLGKLTTRGVAF